MKLRFLNLGIHNDAPYPQFPRINPTDARQQLLINNRAIKARDVGAAL